MGQCHGGDFSTALSADDRRPVWPSAAVLSGIDGGIGSGVQNCCGCGSKKPNGLELHRATSVIGASHLAPIGDHADQHRRATPEGATLLAAIEFAARAHSGGRCIADMRIVPHDHRLGIGSMFQADDLFVVRAGRLVCRRGLVG